LGTARNSMDTNGILTEAEAAAMIVDLKPQTLAKWRLRRKGPKYLKLGGKIRYRVIDIQEWMEASLIDPAAQPLPVRKHVKRKAA
jgi:predicted DNA-binding transcriptional regulator AlpA